MDQAQLPIISTQRPPEIINGLLRCSPALGSLLNDPRREMSEIVRAIADRPDLMDEARIAVAVLDQALRLDEDTRRLSDVLAMNGIAFGLDASEHPPEWWDAKWKPYIDVLAPFSLAAVERAFTMWNAPGEHGLDPRQSTFYPKPSDLHTLATKAKSEMWQARARAAKAIEGPERPWHVPASQRMSRADMIAAGYMTEDGRIVGLSGSPKAIPSEYPQRPAEDQHAVAARMRSAGVPINRAQIGPEEEAVG